MSATLTRHRSLTSSETTPRYMYNELSTPLSKVPGIQDISSPLNGLSKVQRVQHAVVSKVNNLLSINKTAKQSGRWCIINFVLATLFYFGFFQFFMQVVFGVSNGIFIYVDFISTLMFSWNVLTNLYFYCLPVFHHQHIILNPQQKSLLGISPANEKLFKLQDTTIKHQQAASSVPNPSQSPSSYPVNRRISQRTTSEYSPGRQQPSPSTTQYSPSRSQYSPSRTNYSPGRDSTPLFSRGSQQLQFGRTASYSPCSGSTPSRSGPGASISSTPSPSVFLNTSKGQSPGLRGIQTSPGRVSSQDDKLLDYEELDRYMKREEENEIKNRRGHHDSPKISSFWSYGRAAYDYMPNFGTYQLATRSKIPSVKDDDDTPDSPFRNDEILRKLCLQRKELDVWIENFRKWLAQTVLEPLVKEISQINKKLRKMGSPELQIGTISHSSLQNLLSTKAQHLPSLETVIPYLDVTTNQKYLVGRLKELGTGGCLRLYRWDSGGLYKNKEWNNDLPTDAQIICHLFCTYMDTHLPSNPRYPDGKSFTGLHFLKTPVKPEEKKSSLCLYQSRTQKPHFKVLVEDEVCDLPKGRNNLFCALVLFLYYAKRNFHGMLERVNLGMSGINVLWILEKR